jgi:hypothetical protein
MSSIEPTERDEALLAFFDRWITAAGEALHERGHAVPLRPAAAEASYYTRRDPAQPLVFDAAAVQIDHLAELWRQSGREELCTLVPELEALWRAMEPADDAESVSSFIYVMF